MGTPSERASRSTSGLLLYMSFYSPRFPYVTNPPLNAIYYIHTARCTGASIVRMGDRT